MRTIHIGNYIITIQSKKEIAKAWAEAPTVNLENEHLIFDRPKDDTKAVCYTDKEGLHLGRSHKSDSEIVWMKEERQLRQAQMGRASYFGNKEKRIIAMAEQAGWRLLWIRDTEKRMRFKRGKDDILDFWYEKGTIGTIITHPTKGRTQLFRKNADEAMLKKILNNPRVHTDEGYYKK